MPLKITIDEILKNKNRSLSWLASEMGKTFEGLKLSLVNESIKYKDIQKMSETLEVSPAKFFETDPILYSKNDKGMSFSEAQIDYPDLKIQIKNCNEMVETLKDQLKDKEKIISLLSKK